MPHDFDRFIDRGVTSSVFALLSKRQADSGLSALTMSLRAKTGL